MNVAYPLSAGGIPRADLYERLVKRGFRRLLVEEEALDLEGLDPAAGPAGDDMLVLVDRVAAREDTRARLVDSLETAFEEGGGRAVVRVVGGPLLLFSEGFDCARCGRTFEEPQYLQVTQAAKDYLAFLTGPEALTTIKAHCLTPG